MMIEITSVTLRNKIVTIDAVDVSDENLMHMERVRDDGFEKEVCFKFDTTQQPDLKYLNSFLHRQKATRNCSTWGQALQAIVGTHTMISGKYRVWE